MTINRCYRRWRVAAALAAAVGAGGCSTPSAPAGGSAAAGGDYPGPRFPAYLKPISSVEEVLPHVRSLVRTKSGVQGAGLGVASSGDTVAFVTTTASDPLIVEAIRRAMQERGVTVNVVPEYEMVGVSRDDAVAFDKIRRSYTSEQGYMEAATWVEANFPDPEAVKTWLKGRRPDLYDKLFPQSRDLSPRLKDVQQRLLLPNLGQGIQAYLRAHPEVRGVFWGKGGGTFLRRNLHPLENKFLGLFLVDNRWDVMSALGTYPGDVWQLAEEQLMEPLVHVDKMTAKDPEGTDVWADINEEQAAHWARGVYQRGHLYMFPNQATGRFGYSVVDYPAFQKEWLPREPLAIIHGTIAGTTNHTGFFPRWEIHFDDKGYIKEVKGGGTTGEALREFMQLPGINDLVYPFHAPEHKGYWYLYEIAFGTNPKAFRNPQGLDDGTVIPERLRSGVIHWGLGITLHHDPGVQTQSQKLLDFTKQYNMPRDHGFHTHTYFTTYKVHLRNADRWVTLLDKGRMTSLDNAEVRALASRYGDPDQLLTEDWRPEMPGINAPGDYMKDYAPDPWKTVKAVIDRVIAGTYQHFYPVPRQGRGKMRRLLPSLFVALVGTLLLTLPHGRGLSIEQMFVAQTQAASAADTTCTMPPLAGGDDDGQAQALAIPKSADNGGADLAPVRMVVDPYPSFNGVVVDPVSDLVMMSDTNRKSLLLYKRTAGAPAATQPAMPVQQIMGPETGIGFVAGVAMDPEHRELFTVNNDVEDRMVVFDYDARGNVRPKRLLYVPHQSWGIAFAKKRDELALSVQTPNMFVVFKRGAQKFDAPVRSVRGPKTQMADPHGIYFDETHNEVFVANHGNFRPGELITSYTAYDARESRQERTGDAFSETARGRFVPSSVTVFDGDAKGDVAPLRVIQGPLSQIDWPMGIAVDEASDEIFVANNGDNSILVFARTANGNVQPRRVIRGAATGIKGPMGVAVAKDEIWVANFGDHTALVFPRTAAGNVAPRRILRNAPAGKETSGFGNPYSVAYDTKREEILVPN